MTPRFCLILAYTLCSGWVNAALHILPDGTIRNPRTICGTNDMLDMINQNAAIQKMGMPVGIYQGSTTLCTGTLISQDLFLTARHCMEACNRVRVTFGFLNREKETFPCKQTVEFGNTNLNQDYFIFKLDGSPGVRWGWYDMTDRVLQPNEKLMMIHHPGGSPMKVSLKDCSFKSEQAGLLQHQCDTEGGSSGTGILSPDFERPENSRIVAVHTLGGCRPASPSSTNSGPSLRQLASISPLIKSMVK